MRRFTRFLLLSLIQLLPLISFAQNLSLYQYESNRITGLIHTDTLNHASVRDLYPFTKDVTPHARYSGWKNQLYNRLFTDHLITVRRPVYTIIGDPLFNAELGQESPKAKETWQNTRGLQVFGRIQLKEVEGVEGVENVEFYTSYYESQSKLPGYLDSLAWLASGMPGQGYFHLSDGSWDHGYATGWVRYNPNKIFSFEAGHGKNFFGNGYRSLLLSDNSRNYPYLRIDSKFWRFHYTNLWAELADNKYKSGPNGAYQKKYGVFHYFSYSLLNRLDVSFFEAIIWQGRDSLHNRGFDVNYLNPFVFLRPVEWSLGSPDNALLGMNLSYRFLNQSYVYGQVLIDELVIDHILAQDGFWANKYAGQLGIKSWIPLDKDQTPSHSVLNSGLFLQSEFNFARPFTYSHWTSKQNFGHFSQPLAHPLGANFFEWVNFARVNWKRFTIEGRYSKAWYGANADGLNYGQDIFIPYTSHVTELGNEIGQGLETTLTYTSATFSWLMNPASLLNIFCTVTDRRQVDAQKDLHSFWITFGVRNSIRNFYYDY